MRPAQRRAGAPGTTKTTYKILLALLALSLFAVRPAFASEEIQVSVDGRPSGMVKAYKVGAERYVSAKEVGEALGGGIYWYPVAGRVVMNLQGKSLVFMLDSRSAAASGEIFKLKLPVIARAGQALIPLSLFTSSEFFSWSNLKIVYNVKTGLLSVERQSTVGPVRFYSYGAYTRIVVDLAKTLAFTSSRKGASGVELSIPLGVIESAESAKLSDGIVEDYALRQDSKTARLSVRLKSPIGAWRVRELAEPRRIALDFYRFPGGPSREPMAKAAAPSAPTPPPPVSARARRRIVIDAGHGGRDSGATGRRGTDEKDINLLAARELAVLLRQEDVFEVLLTRGEDILVPLAERSRLANEFKADLFISLHCNASGNPKDSGYEIYFLSEKASNPEAERLAEFENSVLQYEDGTVPDQGASEVLLAMAKNEHINEAGELSGLMARVLARRLDLVNRGVKQADFYVLRGTNAPAVLVEMAYVSNRKDETKLESSKYRRRLVDGLYAGVVEYAKRRGWLEGSDS